MVLFLALAWFAAGALLVPYPAADSVRPPALVAQVQIDVNRPRTPYDCDLPIGREWYGSRQRCLAELCAGRNVYNEYVFDADNRRRKNPCYRQNPTSFPED